ncbi:unnamed protein product [Arabis nemorensis]|uniref:MATH domain-containing protein n=1 Tax=Arabis nemorensis TaxID=586526 RepID=A0A565BXV1_9BRAS|nr:unnamed protein product [Arabis nemorensis]
MSDEQVKEKRFSWVLKRFSFSQDEMFYSRPFVVTGCNWRILACAKGDRNGYLSVYLELVDPASLSSGWRRQVKFRLTLVNKIRKQSTKVCGSAKAFSFACLWMVAEGKCWFDASDYSWGFKEFLPLYKLHARGNGFLVRNKLIIVAEVQILSAIVVPEETMKVTEPLRSKERNQADDVSVEDTDASEEDPDDDDDAISPVLDDGGRDRCPLNQPNACKTASHAVGNRGGMSGNDVAVSSVDNDDGTAEEVLDDGSSLILNDRVRDIRSLHQLKSLEDASQTVENGALGSNSMSSVTETSKIVIKEIQPVKEIMDVNGFQVSSSQVESVSLIFERHPDIAVSFRPKNHQIRRAYINALLSLIETLCQSPEKLSEDDLSNAEETLGDLIDAGFKLDWLKKKLNEVSEKKKKEQSSVARIQTMEEQLQKLKLMFLDLEAQLQKEKAVVLAVVAPLSFNDVVC